MTQQHNDAEAGGLGRRVLGGLALGGAVALSLPAAAQRAGGAVPSEAEAATEAGRVLAHPGFRRAEAFLRADHDRTVADIVRITEIPAPPFKEERRGRAFAEMLRAHGLRDVETDAEGNVLGLRPGTDPQAGLVVVSAHLDTVFPEGTEVTVRREGTRLYAPGVGDDSRGLAVLLAWLRAMDEAQLRTRAPLLIVGTVGEEGLGDLRGVKHLFREGRHKDRIAAFFSVDGTNPARVTHGGVGSKRYRVAFKGPGGHSFGAFGLVNPAFALARAADAFSRVQVPATPKTTYSIGVMGGGTSVNAIPEEVWMEVDMRSESAEELAKVEAQFLALLPRAAADENAARSTAEGEIRVEPRLVGDRPAGSTPLASRIVRLSAAVIAARGGRPEFNASSTDSNMAMSLGVPALTIGSGGGGGRSHSPAEWIDVEPEASARGMATSLATVLAMAGLEG